MPRLSDGYAYELRMRQGVPWNVAPDDDWDTIMNVGGSDARHVGTRLIDGMRFNVFDCGAGTYRAQTCPVSQ